MNLYKEPMRKSLNESRKPSGFLFDVRSMPHPIQILTHIVAAR